MSYITFYFQQPHNIVKNLFIKQIIHKQKREWSFRHSHFCLARIMEGEGFEPSKSSITDLQSAPFGHSGTPPKKADDRT